MRVIICGGGTAGHVTPAIAIAEAILESSPDSQITFVGREGGDENNAIIRRGFTLEPLRIEGLSRKFSVKSFKKMFVVFKALGKAGAIIKKTNPDIVIGTGGYVCWPVLRAAQLMGVPTVIHESNATPGLTTRLLAPRCKRVLLNFPYADGDYRKTKNLCIVGNPLPSELTRISREGARRRLGLSSGDVFILSFGGSGGAGTINEASVSLMKNYSARSPRIKHIHATGKKYYDAIKKAEPGLCAGRNGCRILPYIDDIYAYMKAADIIICRCGAMTLSEAACAGVAPILIPSPNVTDDHQYKNAKRLVDRGAAIMIEERELNERTMLDAVRYLECNPDARRKMRERISEFYKSNCRETIIKEIEKCVK